MNSRKEPAPPELIVGQMYELTGVTTLGHEPIKLEDVGNVYEYYRTHPPTVPIPATRYYRGIDKYGYHQFSHERTGAIINRISTEKLAQRVKEGR
jgi:hypothetical protein